MLNLQTFFLEIDALYFQTLLAGFTGMNPFFHPGDDHW
jgi:hypothetical protein